MLKQSEYERKRAKIEKRYHAQIDDGDASAMLFPAD